MLSQFQNLSIRSKILLVVSVQALILSGAFLWMFASKTRESAKEDTESQAKRIIAMAKSVREDMSSKWKQGIFSEELLAKWAHQGEDEKVLGSVPIVTAWRAVMARSEENGYQLRTPKFNPRNSDNEPDAVETEALKAFQADPTLADYSYHDQEANAIRFFSPIRLTSECMICHGDPGTSNELWGNEDGRDPLGYAMENYSVGDLHGAFEVVQSLDAADSRTQSAVTSGLFLMAIVLVPTFALLLFVIQKSILKPLHATVELMKEIATGDGDLTRRLTSNGKDEIAKLGHWFNIFVGRIDGVVRQISGGARTLNSATGSVFTSAETVSAVAEQSKRQSLTVSSAAEEMSINMSNVSEFTVSMSERLEGVSNSIAAMQTNIGMVSQNAKESATVAKDAEEASVKSHEQIGDMGKATHEIGVIVDVIQDIAEQTNLLALNATIEAARAGDAGKGFAVVAEEVKQLAKQTADATENIRLKIENVQQRANVAISSVEEINQIIASVSELSRQIAASVDEQNQMVAAISSDVTTVSDSAQQVASQIRESSNASREITENIAQVDVALAETVSGAANSLAAGDELKQLATRMQDLVSQFRVSEDTEQSIAT